MVVTDPRADAPRGPPPPGARGRGRPERVFSHPLANRSVPRIRTARPVGVLGRSWAWAGGTCCDLLPGRALVGRWWDSDAVAPTGRWTTARRPRLPRG